MKPKVKKTFKENYKLAVFAFLILVFVAVLGLGGVKLRSERSKTAELFYSGVNNDSLGIYNDLQQRFDASYNLTVVAGKYFESTDRIIQNVLTARTALMNSSSPDAMFSLNHDLTVACDELYNKLNAVITDESDKRLAAKQFDELSSRNSTISHDGYNAAAISFNSLLSSFPANIIAAANGIDDVDLFR